MWREAKKALICAGKMTVNSRFGAKVAVLAGDFLFAQSSWFLANLDNLEVLLCQADVIVLYICHFTCCWDEHLRAIWQAGHPWLGQSLLNLEALTLYCGCSQ